MFQKRLVWAFLLALAVAACGQQSPSGGAVGQAPAAAPGSATEFGFYGVPIVTMDRNWKETGLANAVLVDRELGVFATNSHVVAFGQRFKVRIGNGWYGAQPISSCISWHADLALLRISQLDTFVLPPAAELRWRQFGAEEKFTVASHVLRESDDEWFATSFQSVKARLLKRESDWGISLGSAVEMLEWRYLRMKGERIPKEEAHKLYEQYLALEVTDESRKEFPFPEQPLKAGTSGSPVVDKDGKVVAIHSSSNSGRALAVPAYEIERLLVKYRRELKNKQNKSR